MKADFRYIAPEVILHLANNYDLSPFVQSITIGKSIKGTCSMSLTLNPSIGKEVKFGMSDAQIISFWKKWIRPMNIISAKINKLSNKTPFLGMIDQVTESIITNNKNTGKVLNVTCSLLVQKLLMRDTIKNSSLLFNNDKAIEMLGAERAELFKWFKFGKGATEETTVFLSGDSAKAIDYILRRMPVIDTTIKQVDGTEVKIVDYFDVDKAKNFTFLEKDFLFNGELGKYEGNILGYIKACYDSAFYETFFDTIESEGRLYNNITIRPTPFSYKALDEGTEAEGTEAEGWTYWDELPTTEIDSQDRLEENLGISDYEVKNFFQLEFTNTLIAQAGGVLNKFAYNFPIVNFDSVKEFGLRPLTANSTISLDWNKFLEGVKRAIEDGDTGSIEKDIVEKYIWRKREKFAQWYSFPYFESGQMTIYGNEDINIGERIYYADKPYFYYLKYGTRYKEIQGTGMEYYVEGLQHTYSYPNSFTTTLLLTRGQPVDMVANWYDINKVKGFGNWTDISFNDTLFKKPKKILSEEQRARLAKTRENLARLEEKKK